MVFKFQSNIKQIEALCSLEIEFYPLSGNAILRAFILPSEIINNEIGYLTLPLSLLSGNTIDNPGGMLIGLILNII